MSNEEHIEEILHDADEYGLRIEVIMTAMAIMDENPKIERVDAYQMAFDEWVK